MQTRTTTLRCLWLALLLASVVQLGFAQHVHAEPDGDAPCLVCAQAAGHDAAVAGVAAPWAPTVALGDESTHLEPGDRTVPFVTHHPRGPPHA